MLRPKTSTITLMALVLATTATPTRAQEKEGGGGGNMVLVPAGDFLMGCNPKTDSDCDDDEKPGHTVYLDAFYIDKTEVTVAQYGACVKAGRCSTEGLTKFDTCNWGKDDRSKHPINCVDWNQSKSYCAWADKQLPTEAQWEKAARGTDGRKYPWGSSKASCRYAILDDGGNGCGKGHTWPVCSKTAGNSPYGACDMAGNVWEWTADWYDKGYYSKSPRRNPKGPASSEYRVLRGGGWFSYPPRLRTSGRYWFKPVYDSYNYGFRCVRPSTTQSR